MERLSGVYKRYNQLITLITGFVLALVFNADSVQVTRTLWTNEQLRSQIANSVPNLVDRLKEFVPSQEAGASGTPPPLPSTGAGTTTDAGKAPASPMAPPTINAAQLLKVCQDAGRRTSDAEEKQGATAERSAAGGQESVSTPSGSKSPDPKRVDSDQPNVPELLNTLTDCLAPFPIGWHDWEEFYATFTNIANPGELFLKLAGLLLTGLAVSLGAPFWFDILSTVVRIRGTGKKPEGNA